MRRQSVTLYSNDVEEIEKLIEKQKYISISAFVRQAVKEKLKNEGIKVY